MEFARLLAVDLKVEARSMEQNITRGQQSYGSLQIFAVKKPCMNRQSGFLRVTRGSLQTPTMHTLPTLRYTSNQYAISLARGAGNAQELYGTARSFPSLRPRLVESATSEFSGVKIA